MFRYRFHPYFISQQSTRSKRIVREISADRYLILLGNQLWEGERTVTRDAINHVLLQDPPALKILAGEFDEGDTILVERGPDGLTFSVTVPVVEGEVV